MFAKFAVLATLAASVSATVFMTSPVAKTSCAAGQNCTITWQDDGSAPSLSTFGLSSVGLYVGNAIQQTQIQPIADNVDVSKLSTVIFQPDATIGPNSGVYFIRFTSANTKDTASPQFPAEAFSAKFTLTGMTGTFSAAVQSQIDAASTAPIGGSTASGAASTAAPASAASASTTPASSSSKVTSSSSSTSAKPTGSASAANRVTVTGAAGLVGVVAALVGMTL